MMQSKVHVRKRCDNIYFIKCYMRYKICSIQNFAIRNKYILLFSNDSNKATQKESNNLSQIVVLD